jgi:hypothetical protein
MAHHSNARLPEHFSFLQHMPGFPCPFRELAQALPQLLPAGSALDLEMPFLGLSAVMRKTQKGKVLWLFASLLRLLSGKSPEFDAARLLLRQLKAESFQSVLQPFEKTLCIVLVLKAGQKIIRKAKIIRLGSACSPGG